MNDFTANLINIEEKIIISQMLDYYGALLSDSQREIMKARFDEDLSLAEIGEREGISRQGVRDAILRGVKQLYDYENKLRLIEKADSIRNKLINVIELLDKVNNDEIKVQIERLISSLEDN